MIRRLSTNILPIIDDVHINENKTQLSWNLYEATDRKWWYKHIRHAAMENMTTMGKIDISDLMISIR